MKIYRIAQESEISEMSDQYEWKDSYETFDFLVRSFDVNKARKFIINSPRKIIQMGLSGVAKLVPRERTRTNEDGTMSMTMGLRIDWDRIDAEESAYNLSFPVIIANINGDYLPIDGWHRIAKAVDQGIDHLPAVILSADETQEVLI